MTRQGVRIERQVGFTRMHSGKAIAFFLAIRLKDIKNTFVLQVYHWNTTRKIEQYYYDLAKLNKGQDPDE